MVALSQVPCVLRVVDDAGGIPGATVLLEGRPVGATNASGDWGWNEGRGKVQVQALGYETVHWEGVESSTIELGQKPAVVALEGPPSLAAWRRCG